MTCNPFRLLDDAALKIGIEALARNEREANADIIWHLLLIKERRLYVPLGYDSIFAYCVEHLGFSRSTAYRRKTVMEKAERFPDLVDRLRNGRLHLCAAAAVAAHLTEDNQCVLLDEACGLSFREVETLLLRRSQKKTPVTPCFNVETNLDGAPSAASPSSAGSAPSIPPAVPPAAAFLPRTVVKPLSADASRVNMTLKETTLAQLRRLKEVLRGKSDDEVLSQAMTLLLERVDPKVRHARREQRQAAKLEKTKAQDHSRENLENPENSNSLPPPPRRGSRRGRLADRDQVIADADGRCSFVAADGHRCNSRFYIEVDHARPWALGGDSNRSNLRPMCKVHNAWLAKETFGPIAWRQVRNNHKSAEAGTG